MSERGLFLSSTGFAVLALLLLMSSAIMASSNRSIQGEVVQRQSMISSSANLVQLNQNLAQALAEIATTKDDKSVRELLASQGITIRTTDKAERAVEKAAAEKTEAQAPANQAKKK